MISVGILDRSSPVPLHAQLTQGLRVAVVEGRLAAGETLPSTRALADDLGVARGTVVAAYETLVGEGYLLARPGARTVVAELPRSPVVSAEVPAPTAAVASSVVDLRPGRPGSRGLADAAWRSAWRRASAVDPASDVEDERGLPALRSEIARHLGRTRGVTVDPGDVIVTAGTSDALLLAALALPARRADGVRRVGVENPGYPRVRTILDRLGIEMVPLPVTLETGWDLDAIEQHHDLDAIVVTPHHHYPLGNRWDAAARARLIAWARQHRTVVIEDDYDSEFRFEGHPRDSLQGLDGEGRVAFVGSFSKTLAPSLRLGYIVVPPRLPALREALLNAKHLADAHGPSLLQHALARWMAEGGYRRHLRRCMAEYARRRERLRAGFDTALAPWLRLLPAEAGFHQAALLRPGLALDAPRLAALARRVDVGLYPLQRFGNAPDGLLMGFGRVAPDDIDTAVGRIGEILDAAG